MSAKDMLAWLRGRAPFIDWDVVDAGMGIVISAPYPDGIRKTLFISYADAARVQP